MNIVENLYWAQSLTTIRTQNGFTPIKCTENAMDNREDLEKIMGLFQEMSLVPSQGIVKPLLRELIREINTKRTSHVHHF